jgi:hypothetical protein
LITQLNRADINKEVDSILKELSSITDDKIKKICNRFFDLIEVLASENDKLTVERQQFKDEVNLLKGEQGKPDIKPNKRNKKDLSSEQERGNKGSKKDDDSEDSNENKEQNFRKKKRNRQSKLDKIKIDRKEQCKLDKSILPADAINKGPTYTVIQDIKIVTDNVEYCRETYYSPSLKKTFLAPLPKGIEGKGEFGIGIRSLIPLFKSECHLSESSILTFFKNFDIQISSAYISNQWTKGYEHFNQEKKDIVRAGIASGSYHQIDDTSARVNGNNHYTHVLCNPYYSAFFTTERKDRLTVLDVFRNFAPREFIYNKDAIDLLDGFNFSKKLMTKIDEIFEKNTFINDDDFEQQLTTLELKSRKERQVKEACAIAAYKIQTAIPVIGSLICDDAPQFKLLTKTLGLCWVHDGRHYKKLNPILNENKLILDDFLGNYWEFYHKLKAYKISPTPQDKDVLYMAFDTLFSTTTDYKELNVRIAKTLAKRTELLACLEQPELPLHNNASELGARVQARVRDVSLHTISDEGTEIKDSMMTISQTAKKLKVGTYKYIWDKVSEEFKLPSLAEQVYKKSQELT